MEITAEQMRNSEIAYQKVKRMGEICRGSSNREAAIAAVHAEFSRLYGEDMREVVKCLPSYIFLKE